MLRSNKSEKISLIKDYTIQLNSHHIKTISEKIISSNNKFANLYSKSNSQEKQIFKKIHNARKDNFSINNTINRIFFNEKEHKHSSIDKEIRPDQKMKKEKIVEKSNKTPDKSMSTNNTSNIHLSKKSSLIFFDGEFDDMSIRSATRKVNKIKTSSEQINFDTPKILKMTEQHIKTDFSMYYSPQLNSKNQKGNQDKNF